MLYKALQVTVRRTPAGFSAEEWNYFLFYKNHYSHCEENWPWLGARAEVGRLFMRLLIVTWTKMVAVCRGGDVSLTSLFRYKGLLKLLVLQQIILRCPQQSAPFRECPCYFEKRAVLLKDYALSLEWPTSNDNWCMGKRSSLLPLSQDRSVGLLSELCSISWGFHLNSIELDFLRCSIPLRHCPSLGVDPKSTP